MNRKLSAVGVGAATRPARSGAPVISTDAIRRFLRPSWWLYTLIAVSLVTVAGSLFFKTWHKSQMDLSVYYTGAQHLFDGKLYSVYGGGSAHLPFTYPPFAALFFWPLTAFHFGTAQGVWLLISAAALVGLVSMSIWAVRPELERRNRWMLTLLVLGPVFWFEPIEANFSFGQINILLALMIMVDLLVLTRSNDRHVPAGALTGVAAAIKLVPLVFVAFLAVTRQWRALAWSIAAFLAASGLALVCNPKVTWQFLTKYAFDESRIGSVFYISNQSFRGAIDRLTHTTVSPGVAAMGSVVIVVGGLYVAWAAYRQGSSFLAVIVTGVTGLLASPITWTHHIVWIVPIVAWLLLGFDRPKRGTIWATVAILLAWSAPVWWVSVNPVLELRENLVQAIAGNAYFFALLAFLVNAGIMVWRRSSHGRGEVVSAFES